MIRRRVFSAISGVVSLLLVGLLSGCSFNLYEVQLPGGEATGKDVYRITVEFGDVLDLVPQSAVKVNDVTVGTVEKISLEGFVARVTIRLKNSVKLPDNAAAAIRQSSLLGEKFVSLSPPVSQRPVGALGNGDVIPLSRTTRSTEVEEIFSALSLLLNGGGLQQLQIINQELSKALTGRETNIKDLLDQLNTFIGGLEAQKAQIVRALTGLDRLTATLVAQQATITAALDSIAPGLKVLADERQQFVAMLAALTKLSAVGTRVILTSQAATVANLRALQPILANLAAAGNNLPGALELLFTYPFPRNFPEAVTGDFTRLSATFDLSLATLLANLGLAPPAQPGAAPTAPGQRAPGSPGSPALPQLPGVPQLPDLPKLPGGTATTATPTPTSDLLLLLMGGLGK